MFDKKAIVVAANPYKHYHVSDTLPPTKDLGDVEVHREHRTRYGKVFWDIIPPGRLDTPWKHPEINTGYFYVSKCGMAKYRMSIEYIRQWKDIDRERTRDCIPQCRRSYLESDRDTLTYYAILIGELEQLRSFRELREFTLVSTKKPVERVQNYVIVYDPGYR